MNLTTSMTSTLVASAALAVVVAVQAATVCAAQGPAASVAPSPVQAVDQDGRPEKLEPQCQEPPGPAEQPSRAASRKRALQLDVVGDYRFSRFNFTDLKRPYNGVDGFAVLRVAAWLDSSRRVGLFGDVIPVIASVPEFFFQRYVQAGVGVQVYPVGLPAQDPTGVDVEAAPARRILRPLRLFAQVSGRGYYDRPSDTHLEGTDVQVGADYYYDNVFEPSRVKAFVFTVVGYHTTNFSIESYNGLIWSGNVKVGPAVGFTPNFRVIPYAVADWTYAPGHGERFFENFIRAGGGLRWYPRAVSGNGLGRGLLRRLHVYGELVRNVRWLGQQPPAVIEPFDVRAGVAFATGGIYRDSR